MVEKLGLDLIGIEYFVMVLKQDMIKKAVFKCVALQKQLQENVTENTMNSISHRTR